jgi:hypothetical protein
MDGPQATDWISSISNVAVALAAAFAAYQGYRSLSAWRGETIGRKRIELAEQVLTDFYEAKDIIRWVRLSLAYSTESRDRPGRDEENESLRHHRDTFYVPLKRLSDHAEFFARLRARRYSVMATFGTDAAKCYDTLNELKGRIEVSASELMRLRPNNQSRRNIAREERLEADVWNSHDENDPINPKLEELIKSVESRFRQEIEHAKWPQPINPTHPNSQHSTRSRG